MTESRPLTTAEVARRLGVKRETVYAYVSRGRLPRHPASTAHASRFDPEAVERLARGARHTDRSGALEVIVETELTALDPAGSLRYRGRDAVELARFRDFEHVAGLLWGGDAHTPWTLTAADARRVAAVSAALGAGTDPLDRLPVAIAALGAGGRRFATGTSSPVGAPPQACPAAPGDARDPETVRRAGGRILAAALQAVTGTEADGTERAAQRLWPALAGDGRRPRPAQLAALDAALVLLADHELAASTLSARVAASTWADPCRVALAGLSALGGPLHGLAGRASEALLADAARPTGPYVALHVRIDAGALAGFGHRVYLDRDPRAEHLLSRLPRLGADPARLRAITATRTAAEALELPAPNVDFALAALVYALELAPGSTSVIFAIARLAGLIAHALEEYPYRLRFRPRATYVGPSRG